MKANYIALYYTQRKVNFLNILHKYIIIIIVIFSLWTEMGFRLFKGHPVFLNKWRNCDHMFLYNFCLFFTYVFFFNFIILELLCYFFVCLLWIWNKIKSLLLLCVFDYYKNMDIEIFFFYNHDICYIWLLNWARYSNIDIMWCAVFC